MYKIYPLFNIKRSRFLDINNYSLMTTLLSQNDTQTKIEKQMNRATLKV